MTCIAAVVKNGKMYVGSDSCAVGDGLIVASSTPKMKQYKDTIVGFAGSWSIGRRVSRELIGGAEIEYVVDNLETDEDDWSLIIVRAGRIYDASGGDRSLVEIRPDPDGVTYHAIGTGQAVALGALYSDHNRNAQSVENALNAAAKFTIDVRGPFEFLTM